MTDYLSQRASDSNKSLQHQCHIYCKQICWLM